MVAFFQVETTQIAQNTGQDLSRGALCNRQLLCGQGKPDSLEELIDGFALRRERGEEDRTGQKEDQKTATEMGLLLSGSTELKSMDPR